MHIICIGCAMLVCRATKLACCHNVGARRKFCPHNGTGSMVTYSSMPGKKMLTPVVGAGSPELGPVTGRHCSNVEKGLR
jgi:hypothetical protein